MPGTATLVGDKQRSSLDGFGEEILNLVSLENGLTAKVGPVICHKDFVVYAVGFSQQKKEQERHN